MGMLRTVEVCLHGAWTPCSFRDIRKGDIFRLFESDGKPVMWEEASIFLATGDAHELESGRWGVHSEKFRDRITECIFDIGGEKKYGI